ncbi:MAG: ABC transporter ATP-binding protein [Anaerolineae bacterium]|nr:ABC transporter ATP-binding protein [Anaerolineae bacterium]
MSEHTTTAPIPTLEIKNLVVEYRTEDGIVHAVNGLDLRIEKGKTLGLVGETGAGKTTTGLAILRLVAQPPGVIVDGSIHLNGENLLMKSEKEMEKIRGKQVSMIFQDPMTSLNPVTRVEDQIAEVIELHEHLSWNESLAKARDMLELVGIPGERGVDYPHQFSGGMKQRVVIAIALACSPQLLISDEPTTALDVTIQAQVLQLMKNLREKYQMSMLMITHDLGIVVEICDLVSIMYAGRVVEHGSLEDIFNNTRHPYTEGLFNSLPNLEDRKAKLKPIKGLMPDPSNLPPGCAFCPRCDYAMEICHTDKPGKVYRTEDHFVECHLYSEQNIGEKVIGK